MTEEKFEAVMEHMGEAIEKTVDNAANKAWRHRSVRILTKGLSFLTGIGLLAGSIPLAENGHHTAAKICFAGGCMVIIGGIVEIIVFKRK